MSVVALSPRPHPAARPAAPRPRTAPTLTITVDLSGAALTPGLSRLLDLIGELAATGEGVLRHEVTPPRAGGWRRPADGRPPLAAAVPGPPADPRPESPGGPVHILAGTRVVRQGGRVIPLTRMEFDLLRFLAEHPHRVFTRLQLLTAVWGHAHGVARTVDVHVRRLRAKLGPTNPLVTTVYGVGYRLTDPTRVVIERDR
ncbi:winged helix-turn-helix domain-containing protein [Micromonospora mirobrigensis]|uniref:Transcriptional regulatory protein, C terminal n=1 Tax=Micromonospora mirobrigensis TaxID=262898 RepID=A0A1C4YRJ0_9ACTN|nr:winged helix-turn-helix domain-containing protein [Micromonospora mirobrigensis]SCF23264.1 Transcriptional regulatory protein, C terminal [Micromonospora mirobrigensis]